MNAKSATATTIHRQVFREFMRDGYLRRRSQTRPPRTSTAARQGAQQNPLRLVHLRFGHHDLILHHWSRAQAGQQLRAFEQPVDGGGGEIPIGRRVDLEIAQEQGIAHDNHAGRTALRDDVLDRALLNRDHQREGRLSVQAAGRSGSGTGESNFLHARRIGSLGLQFQLAHGPRQAQVNRRLEEGIDHGMLAIAEIADDDIRSLGGVIRVLHGILPDVHTPLGQHSFEARLLADRAEIKQRQQPAALVEILLDLVQLDFDPRAFCGPAITSRLQSAGTTLVPSSDKRLRLNVVLLEDGGELQIAQPLVTAVDVMFAVALEEIGLQRLGNW